MTLEPVDHALAMAIGKYDSAEITRLVIEENANVNSIDNFGRTQLMCAVMPDELGDHDSLAAIRRNVCLLLELGANKHLTDKNGMTALNYVMQFSDPNWSDKYGYNAVDMLSDSDREILMDISNLLE